MVPKKYGKNYKERKSDILPVYVDLADCDKEIPFEEDISHFCKVSEDGQSFLASKRRIFYLLDGLDNFPREPKEIIKFLQKKDKSRFIISSRPNYSSYIEGYKNIKIVHLEPLTAEERKKFIENYLSGPNKENLIKLIYKKIDDDEYLNDLCKNPLLLYIIIFVVSDREKRHESDIIPLTRAELYGKFLSNLKEHAESCGRITPDPSFEGIPERFLSCLSFFMQCNNELKIVRQT